VYAIQGPTGASLIVDAGTGEWVDHVGELAAPPVALLCTHFFRDHSAGAARAGRELGLPIFVPEREEELFSDSVEHFRGRKTYVIYENYWDHFAPIESIPVAGVLRDYERLDIAGINIEVVPLSGATVNQVGFAFTVPGTTLRAVCSAETVHSPGRVPRVAPLQYDYNDLLGAVEVYFAAGELRRRGVDVLLPSLGTPILQDADLALEQVRESMVALCAGRPAESGMIASEDRPELVQVTDHVWYAAKSGSASWFLVGENGTALALDYGYHDARTFHSLPLASAYRKRPLVHTLDALSKQLGVSRIDVVIPSHFHDDHVSGISMLQRLYGTRCWAHEAFADLLAEPQAHAFPCNWPTPTVVDRRIRDGEAVTWEGFTFCFAPMSGHTRFSSLIGFEADGVRFAHTGDQYSFFPRGALARHVAERLPMWTRVSNWAEVAVGNNHVYRNGALLDGYAQSGRWLRDWRPDIVISGHHPPFITDDRFFELVDRKTLEYEGLHRAAMPLEEDEVHFDLDSWGGWLWPYRLHVQVGEPATVRATVRNPLPRPATLEVRLVGPVGWQGSSALLHASPREEVTCDLQILPLGPCRRQPIAVELRADGRPFGQVAEALVTAGGPRW
jgi:glyoxylase-like metal-dependent hydrolase (beta-lactamase superfamily II)